MIESSLLLSIRDVVPGQKQSPAPESDQARRKDAAADDQVPSMWNFCLFKAGFESKDRGSGTIQAEAAGQGGTL